MPMFIFLTAEQADQVRGPSATMEGAALMPGALVDGRFVLPVGVIADPAHVQHSVFLAGLPQHGLAELVALLPPPPEE